MRKKVLVKVGITQTGPAGISEYTWVLMMDSQGVKGDMGTLPEPVTAPGLGGLGLYRA